MTLNFFQKNVLRLKPNLILNERIFPILDSDIVDFAIKHGLNIREIPQNRIKDFIKIKSFISEIVKFSDEDFIKFITNNFIIIKELDDANIRSNILEKIINNPEILKELCQINADEILDFFAVSNIRDNVNKSLAGNAINNYIMSNPLENIKYLDKFYEVFNNFMFAFEDISILCNLYLENNIVISDNSPGFLKRRDIILNSVLHVKKPSQINNLKRTLKYMDLYPQYHNYKKTEEDIRNIKTLANIIKEIGYIYNKEISPNIMASDLELIFALIENNPYTIEDLEKEKLDMIKNDNTKIKDKIIQSLKNNHYVFSARTPYFLISDSPDLIIEAFELDYDNFEYVPTVPNTCSGEQALNFLKRQYEIIKEHKPGVLDMNIIDVSENPYYTIDEDIVLNDIENINSYKFRGEYLTEDFIKNITNKLLESNYKINDETPNFLLMNSEFMINYIKKYKTIENIPKKFVSRLFINDNAIQNQELIEILKYCNNLKTPFTKYIAYWGIECMQELFKEYGSLVKYLDTSKKYTLEEARNYLIQYMNNNKDMSADELFIFYKNLKLDIREEDFEKFRFMSKSDELIKYAIKQNPKFIFNYTGTNESILILAKDIAEDDSYLEYYNFAHCSKLILLLIEEKSPEYIKYYKGDDNEVVNIALQKGLFKNKDDAYIDDILKNSEILRNSDETIKYLMQNYKVDYIEQYNGTSEEIFKLALDKGYKPTSEKLRRIISARSKRRYLLQWFKNVSK